MKTKIICSLLIIVTLLLAIFGFRNLYKEMNKSEICTDLIDTAIITNIKEIDGKYRYTFSYTYNNTDYSSEYNLDFKKSAFLLNQRCAIYVNPNSPSQYIVPKYEYDVSFLAVALPMFGVTSCGLCIVYLIAQFLPKKKKKTIIQYT